MIVSADIASILARDARELGIVPIYTEGTIPQQAPVAECVRIRVQPLKAGVYWAVAEAAVELCVPDVQGVAALERLTQLERAAREVFSIPYALYDGTPYRYAVVSSGLMADPAGECHFIQINIQFKVLTVKN